jgi:hypothetical protein
MQECEGVGVEEVALAADAAEAEVEVLSGVAGKERLDAEACVDSREERAIFAEGESVGEFGESDEDQGQQGLGVPFVVEQDVQVVEGVLVQEVGFVEEEDGVAAFGGEALDVGGDGVKDACGSGRGSEAEREAELAIEVAASEGGVVTVGEAKAVLGLGEAVAQRAQQAGFSDARFTTQEDGAARVERFEELAQESLFRGREEELFVGQILGKGRLAERKRSEIGGRHGVGSWDEIGVCFEA